MTTTASSQPRAASADRDGMFTWWREADARARHAFVAAALGWMLDSFDVMLYAMVGAALINDPHLHLSFQTNGLLGSITQLAAAGGGIVFAVIADRLGRKRALMAAILMYSIFTAACGFSQTVTQLAIFRVFLGLGMGGEWATGAALVSESFPARHRGKALAFVQSSWAIGYGCAALVNLLVMPVWGWRGVFFVGVLPALFTMWIRRNVEEPQIWIDSVKADRGRISLLFTPKIAKITIFVTLMNACTLFGWWGLNSWVPSYLALGPERGGIGLSSSVMSLFVILMQTGMWLGYVSFGYIADAIGRKKTYVAFVLAASVLLPLYGFLKAPALLLVLGPLVAFFGTGYYSGFGAVIAELYPTSVRATAAGICYNTGRIASAAAPFVVGSLAASRGFFAAFAVAGVAFFFAAILWIWIPETRNAELT
ncbi:MAG: major facilitator superfamily 1 [Acidobacteria bacterium]|nr:major facilitator superfamily 1 [Acidobacteriota bacterium]